MCGGFLLCILRFTTCSFDIKCFYYYFVLLPLLSLWYWINSFFLKIICKARAYIIKTFCRCGRDRMVVGFTTTYAISAYRHWCCEFESRWGRGVQHYACFVLLSLSYWWFSYNMVLNFPEKGDLKVIAL
jgi:hypothetical protein